MSTIDKDDRQVEVRVRFIGLPALHCGDGSVRPLKAKDALLLAMVAAEAPLSRERVAARLWPAANCAGALNNLRQRLHRLGRAAGRPLVGYEAWLRIAPAVDHDLGWYADSSVLDESGTAQPPESFDAWDADLLQDAAVPDAPDAETWLDGARARWLRVRLTWCRALIDSLVPAGRLREALVIAQRMQRWEPWSEETWRRVMGLQAALGESAEALRSYERLATAMREEFGAELAPATQSLAREIARGQAVGTSSADVLAMRQGLMHPPRLIGRANAVRQLETAFEAGNLMLVHAAPGIGKTRLAADFCARHSAALCVGARWGDEAQPYALMLRMLQSLLPAGPADLIERELPHWIGFELAALDPRFQGRMDTPLQPLRLAKAFALLLESLPLIWIDDLQFSDLASLELLFSLAVPGRGPRWLFGLRSRESRPALDAWMAESWPQLQSIQLESWSPNEVVELMTAIGWPEAGREVQAESVVHATGGNPLFVLRSLETMLDQGALPTRPIPLADGLNGLVQAQLNRLSPQALKLARVAALAGADFGLKLASDVLQTSPLALADPWAELRDVHLMRDDGFVHDLLAEAVRRALPGPIAKWLHEAIATCLQQCAAPSARVATHWRQAERWAEAAHQFLAAAGTARGQARRVDEAQLLLQAAECFDAAGLEDARFDALAERVAALVQCAAGEHRAAADALLIDAQGPHQQLVALLAAAESFNAIGDFEAVLSRLPEALAIARGRADAASEVVAARRLAYAMINTGRLADAAVLLDGMVQGIVPHLDAASQAEFFGDYGTVLAGVDRRSEAAAAQQRGIDASWIAGKPSDAITGLANLGINHYFRGRLDLAAQCLEQALQRPEAVEQSAGLGLGMRMTLGQVQRDRGHFDVALHHLQAALDGFRAAGHALWIINVENNLAALWLALGQPARGKHLVSVPADAGLPPFIRAGRLLLQAQTARHLGQSGQALVEEGLHLLQHGDRPDIRLRLWAEHCLLLEAESAIDLTEQLVTEAERREMDGLAALGRARRVHRLINVGRARDAADEAQMLVAALSLGQPLADYTPALWVTVAEAMLAVGQAEASAGATQSALGWVADALARVPAEFKASYLDRNAVHPGLRRLSARLGLTWPPG